MNGKFDSFSLSPPLMATNESVRSNFSSPDSDGDLLSGVNEKKLRKFALPDPADAAFELAEEVLLSVSSGTCNLGQLQLTMVPNNLPLETLTSLTLSDNQLESLPEQLFTGANGSNLVRLSVSSNALKELPESLFSKPNLEVLLADNNSITSLPFAAVLARGEKILPSLRRIGLEFNKLVSFPIELFEHCAQLEEVYLSQNENMLDDPVPSGRLRQSVVAAHLSQRSDQPARLLMKLDNRPRFLQQVAEERWSETLPWVNIELHKIYPDKVLGFLFLGSLRTAQTVTVYHDLNINYILTVARGLEVKLDPGMHHLVLCIDDLPGEDIRPHFEEAFRFIDEAKEANTGILVHCFAGLSRSVTVAAGYIMNRYRKTRDEAMEIIQAARPAAHPNEGFMEMLLEYEKQLKV